MKLILFLDDWFLDKRIDVVRHFQAAKHEHTIENYDKRSSNAFWNPRRRCYQSWAGPDNKRYLVESIDGKKWKRAPGPGKLRIIGDLHEGCRGDQTTLPAPLKPHHYNEFCDKWDTNPSRRYKSLVWPYAKETDKIGGLKGAIGYVACSGDGANWTCNTKHAWFTNLKAKGSDAMAHTLLYNPFNRKWHAFCRAYNLDRRIAMTESSDLENWTQPRVIIHPDASDPPLMQFYGMPAVFLYEDEYFIGIVQRFLLPSDEQTDEHDLGTAKSWAKWLGHVDGQLVYSYDGQAWLRTDRRSLTLERTAPGTFGGSGIYANHLDIGDNGTILIHSQGAKNDHGIISTQSDQALMLHTLRHDGFCFLEPIGGWGKISTRCIVPKSDKITVNYQAPNGQILVQITDAMRKVIPGYSFADCLPLQGDEIYGLVRWNKHKDISRLKGKRIRLEFKFVAARLYAIRLECGLWYTNTPYPLERI